MFSTGAEESLARKSQLIQHYTSEFLATFLKQGTAVARRRMLGTVWVGWTTPPLGWLKLNVDGSVDDNRGLAGVRVVLFDSMGN